MLFSIIIPVFNSSDKIDKLLESIPSHEDYDVEVIIVDDYSDDFICLSDVCSKYDNINLIRNNRKKNAGTCRNIGIENASGEFLIFADADDFFTSNVSSELLSVKDNITYDVFYFSPVSINENGGVSSRHFSYECLINEYDIKHNESIRFWFHVPWSKVIRRGFVNNNNIRYSEVMVSNDVMFSLKCGLLAENINVSKKNIYCVLDVKGSLTKTNDMNKLKIRYLILQEFNDLLISSGRSKYVIPEVIYLYRIMRISFLEGCELIKRINLLFPSFFYIHTKFKRKMKF